MWRWRQFCLAGLVFPLALTSCGELLNPATPTVPPNSGNLQYTFAPVGVNLAKGESAPGGVVQFVGSNDQGIQVSIQGQAAMKHVGDSLAWQYRPGAGVTADYELRVLGVILDRLQATGTVTIKVQNPAPRAAAPPENPSVRYDNAPVTYSVKRGESIPGTTWTFAGFDETQGAQLRGVEGFPYRKTGDSVNWTGLLSSSTYLGLGLRVLTADQDTLRLVGTASVLLAEGR